MLTGMNNFLIAIFHYKVLRTGINFLSIYFLNAKLLRNLISYAWLNHKKKTRLPHSIRNLVDFSENVRLIQKSDPGEKSIKFKYSESI